MEWLRTSGFAAKSHPGRWLAVIVLIVACAVPRVRADELTRQVQEELRKRNLYFGDVDGRYSMELAGALRRYQQRKGFEVTGAVDLETLRSFNLAEPGPAVTPNAPPPRTAPAEASPAPGPGETPTMPWPDMTVLRSEQARVMAPVAAATTPPTPTVAPALASPPPTRRGGKPRPAHGTGGGSSPSPAGPGAEDVRAFVERYLAAGQNNDPTAEMGFYADRIVYFDDGQQDRGFVERDVRAYDHRWPTRHFTLLGPVAVSNGSPVEADQYTMNFRYGFTVSNSRYTVVGRADNAWTVTGHRPEDWRIVAMQEKRVREK